LEAWFAKPRLSIGVIAIRMCDVSRTSPSPRQKAKGDAPERVAGC
jgi:hypothetical protein